MHRLAYAVNVEPEWSYKLQRLPLEALRVMREKVLPKRSAAKAT